MNDRPPRGEALAALNAQIVSCRRCPRLVEWREGVARDKRAAFADQEYWGKPVPSFGDPDARILILGLAPAAHGANRTGRMFTGDRSGDWLFRAMFRAGLASQPTSVDAADGLRLSGAWITAAAHCAPPANKLLSTERHNCSSFLATELELFDDVAVIVCLGGLAWNSAADQLGVRPRPSFGHLAEHRVVRADAEEMVMLGSYHPSQQNTFTGRLTEPMFDAVFERAVEIAGREAKRHR